MIGRSVHSPDAAVSLVYDGVEEAMPWQTLVDHLAESTQSFDATLHVFSPQRDDSGYYLVTSNRTSYKRPEWLQLALRLARDLFPRDSEPHNIEELMSRRQFQNSEIFRQVMGPQQLHYLLAQEVYRDDNICVRLSVDRKPEQGPFNDTDKQLLANLSPHLVKAIRLRLRLQEQEGRIRSFEESLSNMGIGVLALNAGGEILDGNARAQHLLRHNPRLLVRNRRLCLDGTRNQRFKDVLATALTGSGDEQTPPTSIRVEGADGTDDLQLVVKPLRRHTVGAIAGTAAQVYINVVGGEREQFNPARLQEMFSFTSREAGLAVLIAEGCSLNEAAERLSVSINTVKTHLRGIYDKLGVRRQARVVTILNSTMTAMM